MTTLKLTDGGKIRREYQFVQFILDFFSLFLLYLTTVSIIEAVYHIEKINATVIVAEGFSLNPYPMYAWVALNALAVVAGLVLPFVFRRRTKLNQRQYNMWVYAVLLVRILTMIIVFECAGIHFDRLCGQQASFFDFTIISTLLLIAIVVKFTQIRIRAAADGDDSDDKDETLRTIVED